MKTPYTSYLLVFLLVFSPALAYNYTYERLVQVDAINTSLNKVLEFEIDTQSLIFAGKLKSDCSDMVMFDSNKIKILPHHISKCNETDTLMHARVNLSGGVNDFYMGYGDPLATSKASGYATYDLFDDFEDGSINTDWSMASGVWEEQNGYVKTKTPYTFSPGAILINTKVNVSNQTFNYEVDGITTFPGSSSVYNTQGSGISFPFEFFISNQNTHEDATYYWDGVMNTKKSVLGTPETLSANNTLFFDEYFITTLNTTWKIQNRNTSVTNTYATINTYSYGYVGLKEASNTATSRFLEVRGYYPHQYLNSITVGSEQAFTSPVGATQYLLQIRQWVNLNATTPYVNNFMLCYAVSNTNTSYNNYANGTANIYVSNSTLGNIVNLYCCDNCHFEGSTLFLSSNSLHYALDSFTVTGNMVLDYYIGDVLDSDRTTGLTNTVNNRLDSKSGFTNVPVEVWMFFIIWIVLTIFFYAIFQTPEGLIVGGGIGLFIGMIYLWFEGVLSVLSFIMILVLALGVLGSWKIITK